MTGAAGPVQQTPAVSPENFDPVHMDEVEICRPLPHIPGDRRKAWILVRLHGRPLGVLEPAVPPEGLPPSELAHLIWEGLSDPLTQELAQQGISTPLTGPSALTHLCEAAAVEEQAVETPTISIILSTRDRAHRLRPSLEALARLQYPDYEVVVVDNAPTSSDVRDLLTQLPGTTRWQYVREERPGLSWARNAGVAAATGDIVAFIDDDEIADPDWLRQLAIGFSRGSDVGSVSGLIVPARLDTKAQEWFEQFGGHSKGRGFNNAEFSRHGDQSPLYPLPPFGAGGNIAFRREALEAVGGFDVALGAGTPGKSGEETLALTRLMLNDYRVVYQPAAFVRHDHYPDFKGLERQLYGYGVGLTAYYTALVLRQPTLLAALVRLLPQAVRELRSKDSIRTAGMKDFPPMLLRAQRRGMLRGPLAYLHSAWRQRRVRHRGAAR